MKKSIKVAGGIFLSAAALALFGWVLRRNYKKEIASIESGKQKLVDELDKVGIDKDHLDATIANETNNILAKAIYSGLRYNQSVDLDVIDIDKALDAETILHVLEVEKNDRRYLDFLFEIPNYVTGKSFKDPRISDYISAFKMATDELDNIVKAQRPLKKLEGYCMVQIKNPDYNPEDPDSDESLKTVTLQLTPDLYGEFADDRHDGLTAFYEAFIKSREDEDGELTCKIFDWVSKKLDMPDDSFLIGDNSIFMAFKVSFPIAASSRDNIGISLVSAIKCIKWVVDNLTISRSNSNKEVTYRNVIVHAANPDGETDMTYFYEAKEGEGIKISNWY